MVGRQLLPVQQQQKQLCLANASSEQINNPSKHCATKFEALQHLLLLPMLLLFLLPILLVTVDTMPLT